LWAVGFEALAKRVRSFPEQLGEANDMTKEKARQRAKAKAGQKARKAKPMPNSPTMGFGRGSSIRVQVR